VRNRPGEGSIGEKSVRGGQSARLARVALDGLAVLLAILVAFALDAWWSNNQASSRAEQLLGALEEEWDAELLQMETTLLRLQRNREAMIGIIVAHDATEIVAADSAGALFSSIAWSTFKPSFGALNGLLRNELDEVADPRLRVAISSWQGVLAEVGPEQADLHESGLRIRDDIARVATSMKDPWDWSSDSGHPGLGVQRESLAVALINDEQFVVHLHALQIVVLDYSDQLDEARNTLTDNLRILRAR